MNKNLRIAKKITEDFLVQQAKKLFDNGSFVKPLSEFNGNQDSIGLWLSGEGDTTIDGSPIADYDFDYNYRDPDFEKFMKKYNLNFEWYDSGTILCYYEGR